MKESFDGLFEKLANKMKNGIQKAINFREKEQNFSAGFVDFVEVKINQMKNLPKIVVKTEPKITVQKNIVQTETKNVSSQNIVNIQQINQTSQINANSQTSVKQSVPAGVQFKQNTIPFEIPKNNDILGLKNNLIPQLNQTKTLFKTNLQLNRKRLNDDPDLEKQMQVPKPNLSQQLQRNKPTLENQMKNEDSLKPKAQVIPIIKKDFEVPPSNPNPHEFIEKLLNSLYPHFVYKYIPVNNKYAIEINHKSKNIKYVLEVEKSNLLVTYNEKIVNNELKSQIRTEKLVDLNAFIKNEIFSYYIA